MVFPKYSNDFCDTTARIERLIGRLAFLRICTFCEKISSKSQFKILCGVERSELNFLLRSFDLMTWPIKMNPPLMIVSPPESGAEDRKYSWRENVTLRDRIPYVHAGHDPRRQYWNTGVEISIGKFLSKVELSPTLKDWDSKFSFTNFISELEGF